MNNSLSRCDIRISCQNVTILETTFGRLQFTCIVITNQADVSPCVQLDSPIRFHPLLMSHFWCNDCPIKIQYGLERSEAYGTAGTAQRFAFVKYRQSDSDGTMMMGVSKKFNHRSRLCEQQVRPCGTDVQDERQSTAPNHLHPPHTIKISRLACNIREKTL